MPRNSAAAEVEQDDEVAGAMFENNDDGLVVDLQNVEAQKFEVLPARNYNIIIEDNEFSLSKSSGKPMWSLRLNVLDEDFQNRKVFTILSFSEKALPGTKTVLSVIAPELLSGPFNPKDPDIVASIVGRKAKVKVGIQPKSEEYDERNNVKRWFQPDEAVAFA